MKNNQKESFLLYVKPLSILISSYCHKRQAVEGGGGGGYSSCQINFSLKKVHKWQTKITTFPNNPPQLSNQFPINSPSLRFPKKRPSTTFRDDSVVAVLLIKLKCSLHMLQVSQENILSFAYPFIQFLAYQTSCIIEYTTNKGWQLTFPFSSKIICVSLSGQSCMITQNLTTFSLYA